MLDLESLAKSGLRWPLETPHAPGDIVRFELPSVKSLTRLTAVNADLLADVRLGEVEEIWYESDDGTRVQGWMVKPPDFDAAKT